MKIVLCTITVLIALFLLSCKESELETDIEDIQPKQQTSPTAGIFTGVVKEVVQGNSYTYLKVENTGIADWIATSKCQVDIGETVAFTKSLPMNNFTSKELQRTFEVIYFVGRIETASSSASESQQEPKNHHGKPAVDKIEISIEPAEGGVSIAELFSNRDSYANKVTRIKGQVTKVNLSIMGKNWIHLQDGTGAVGSNDLLVTTQDAARVGDLVIFEGTIVLNKDFGSGYSYEVLMEDAKRIVE